MAAATWRRYARSLVVWLEFLAVFGWSWDEATARDVEAFKDWRPTDLRNDERAARQLRRRQGRAEYLLYVGGEVRGDQPGPDGLRFVPAAAVPG